MSFTKTLVQPTGFEVTYWRPYEIKLNPVNRTLSVMIHGYKDQAAFDGGAASAVSRHLTIEAQQFTALTTPNVVPDTIAWLKLIDSILQEAVPELSDATKNTNDVI